MMLDKVFGVGWTFLAIADKERINYEIVVNFLILNKYLIL